MKLKVKALPYAAGWYIQRPNGELLYSYNTWEEALRAANKLARWSSYLLNHYQLDPSNIHYAHTPQYHPQWTSGQTPQYPQWARGQTPRTQQ